MLLIATCVYLCSSCFCYGLGAFGYTEDWCLLPVNG